MILYVFLGIGLIFICLILWMTRKFQSITIDINKDCCVSFLKSKKCRRNNKSVALSWKCP